MGVKSCFDLMATVCEWGGGCNLGEGLAGAEGGRGVSQGGCKEAGRRKIRP